jgi:hypothetical protein
MEQTDKNRTKDLEFVNKYTDRVALVKIGRFNVLNITYLLMLHITESRFINKIRFNLKMNSHYNRVGSDARKLNF